MAVELIESAQRRWPMVSAPHLVALVRPERPAPGRLKVPAARR
jgi:hypothetical protein